MSHFYGKLSGSRGEATRCGDKRSGLVTYAAGWKGAIRVWVRHDPATGEDSYEVYEVPWEGAGRYKHIKSGVLGKVVKKRTKRKPAPVDWYDQYLNNQKEGDNQ